MTTKEKKEALQKTTKILLLGLDNSGKTSILLSLQGNTNLLSFYSLKPTAGLNIVKIEIDRSVFSIWDLGGQQQYRSDHLKNLKKYLQETDKIIFVIDVQDIERYEMALQYFDAIIKVLKLSNEKAQLSIFLHKFDPNLESNANFSSEKISSRILTKVSKIIPPEYSYDIFKTTIYTIFQKTLLQSTQQLKTR